MEFYINVEREGVQADINDQVSRIVAIKQSWINKFTARYNLPKQQSHVIACNLFLGIWGGSVIPTEKGKSFSWSSDMHSGRLMCEMAYFTAHALMTPSAKLPHPATMLPKLWNTLRWIIVSPNVRNQSFHSSKAAASSILERFRCAQRDLDADLKPQLERMVSYLVKLSGAYTHAQEYMGSSVHKSLHGDSELQKDFLNWYLRRFFLCVRIKLLQGGDETLFNRTLDMARYLL
jgi:hypothetical protein